MTPPDRQYVVNMDPHNKECNFHPSEIESIKHIRVDNLHLNPEMTYMLSNLSNFNQAFRADRCNIWTGNIKCNKKYQSPYCPFLPINQSVYRRIYESVFCIRLIRRSDILRHMCPLITGEFNSGLCCNPLHLRIGTHKENRNDILVHELVRELLRHQTHPHFCFQHNSAMTSDIVQFLEPRDLAMIKQLTLTRKIPDPFSSCKCNVVRVDVPQSEFLLPNPKAHPPSISESSTTRQVKRRKTRNTTEDVIFVTIDRPERNFIQEFLAK